MSMSNSISTSTFMFMLIFMCGFVSILTSVLICSVPGIPHAFWALGVALRRSTGRKHCVYSPKQVDHPRSWNLGNSDVKYILYVESNYYPDLPKFLN